MIFWIVCWVITMVILMVPLCYTKERRQRIWDALLCRRKAEESSGSPTVNAGAPAEVAAPETQEVYHYRLSRAQEDEIRESFLIEKLRLYTTEIEKSDIICNSEGSDRTTEEPSSSSSSGRVLGADAEFAVVDVELGPVEDLASSPEVKREDVEGIDIEAGIGLPRRKRTDSTANLSISETSDEDLDEFTDFEGDSTMVAIPIAGECRHDLLPPSVTRTQRLVPNGCAICLSCFGEADKLTWSSNPECSHVFHHACILDWLQTSGKKALRRRRRNQDASIVSYAFDPVARITRFPTYCPCCRQEFILQSSDEETSVDKPVSGDNDLGPDSVPVTPVALGSSPIHSPSIGVTLAS